MECAVPSGRAGVGEVFTGLTMQRAGALSGHDSDTLKRAKVLGVNPVRPDGTRMARRKSKSSWSPWSLRNSASRPPSSPSCSRSAGSCSARSFHGLHARAAARIRTLCSGFFRSFCPDAGVARANCQRSARIPSRKAMERFYDWLRGEKLEGITGSARRACVFNLSSRLRAFDKALTAASMPAPPRPPSASGENPSRRRKHRGEAR